MNYRVLWIYISSCSNNVENSIYIFGCSFENNSAYQVTALVDIHLVPCYTESETGRSKIVFQNCSFINSTYTESMININSERTEVLNVKLQAKSYTSIIGCLFQVNTTQFIIFKSYSTDYQTLHIENTKFISSYDIQYWSITLYNVILILKEPVIFHAVRALLSLIRTINDISFFGKIAGNINCRWYNDSLYYGLNPLTVYMKQIKQHTNCRNKVQPNCSTNNIGPIYPGQHVELHFALNLETTYSRTKVPISVKIYVQNSDYSICQISSMLEAEQPILQNCTEVNYSILSENKSVCMLALYNINYRYPTIYHVKLLKCSPGFSFDVLKKSCQCDNILLTAFITNCYISDQTIQRPANSWIGSTTTNYSYDYHISLHCLFHYYIPYSTHLNFSTPNSQCQG